MMDRNEWRIEIGLLVGFIFGFMLWLYSFEPEMGFFQKPQLIIIPAASGVFIVNQRNRWRKILYTIKENSKQDGKDIIQNKIELEGDSSINGKILKMKKIQIKKRIRKYSCGSNSGVKGGWS